MVHLQRPGVALMVATLGAGYAALPASAEAGDGGAAVGEKASRTRALFELQVNGRAYEPVVVWREGDDVWVPSGAFEESGLDVGRAERAEFGGSEHISLASMAPDVRFSIDKEALALSVIAQPELFPESSVEVGRGRPSEIEYRSAPSAFLNYSARSRDLDHASGFAEAGISLGDALGYASVSASSEKRPVRGLSYVTLDDRDSLRRYTLGDGFADAGSVGGGAFIGGFHIARRFELDPYLVTTPSHSHAGSVLSPSEAEVYVDGRLVRQESLPPGPFRFDDLPTTSGLGSTRVVIRDAFGRTRELSSSYYGAEGLLAPGLSEYHYAAGALRENVGQESFGYRTPAAVARHRRGFTRWLSAGYSAQLSLGVGGLGLSATAGLPVGELSMSGGASGSEAGMGATGSLAYQYRGERVTLGAHGRASTDHYATLDLEAETDRVVGELGGTVGTSLSSRISVSARYALREYRDRGLEDRAGVSASFQLGDRYHLNSSASRTTGRADAPRWSMLATLSVQLGGRHSASMSQTRRAGDDGSRAEVSRGAPSRRGVGYRAFGELGDHPRGQAEVRANTSFGRYRARYDHKPSGGSFVAQASGGLTFIGGRVFATQPVQQAFALVRVPDVEGVRVLRDRRPAGDTDAHGDVLIPNILPHYGNRIGIETGDIPFDYTVPEPEAVVAPSHRGGAIVEFASAKMQAVRGSLTLSGGGAGDEVPKFGELAVRSGGQRHTSPIGKDGEFELGNLPPGAHRARIRYGGETCNFELRVPETREPITQLGSLACER